MRLRVAPLFFRYQWKMVGLRETLDPPYISIKFHGDDGLGTRYQHRKDSKAIAAGV